MSIKNRLRLVGIAAAAVVAFMAVAAQGDHLDKRHHIHQRSERNPEGQACRKRTLQAHRARWHRRRQAHGYRPWSGHRNHKRRA